MSHLPQASLPALPCAVIAGVLVTCAPAFAQAPGNTPGGTAPAIAVPRPSSPATAAPRPTAPATSAPSAPAPRAAGPAGGPVSLRVRPYALLGRPLTFRGTVRARDARRSVVVERYDKTQNAWIAAATATADSHGAFQARWHANLSGRITVRAVVAPLGGTTRDGARVAQAGDSSQPAQITVYRPAIATIYGPGFFGQRTACGQVLTPGTLGVAHRTLPCGTLVEVFYGGRTMTVPVIDRGPYANGADWDLTTAAASSVGIDGTVTLGTITLGQAALPTGATTPIVTTLGSPTAPGDTAPTAPAGATGGAPAG